MKKKKVLLILSSLLLVSCTEANSSSNSSSAQSNENNNSSTSSNNGEDNKYIQKGDENDAVQNPLNWFYETSEDVTIDKSTYESETLVFSYSATSSSEVKLHYHDDRFVNGQELEIEFVIRSSIAGKIQVNGDEVELRKGTKTVNTSVSFDDNCILNIDFSSQDGVLIENGEFRISSISINKVDTVKSIINAAYDTGNYTLKFEDGSGLTGTFKYFDNACSFYKDDQYTDNSVYGFCENEQGIYEYELYSDAIYPYDTYITDSSGNNVHGLYTMTEDIVYNSYNESYEKGIPSLRNILDFGEDIFLATGKSTTIRPLTVEDGMLFKPILSLTCYEYLIRKTYDSDGNVTGYVSDVPYLTIGINTSDELYFSFGRQYGKDLVYTLTDVGTTEESVLATYLEDENNGPGYVINDNMEVKGLLNQLKECNFTYTYTDDETGIKIIFNPDYSYYPATESGHIKLSEGIYSYSISNQEVHVDSSLVTGTSIYNVDGFGNYDFMNKSSAFEYDEALDMYTIEVSNAYNFAYNFFKISSNITKVGIKEEENSIKLGVFIPSDQDLGITSDTWKYAEITNIGTSNIDILDAYIDKYGK